MSGSRAPIPRCRSVPSTATPTRSRARCICGARARAGSARLDRLRDAGHARHAAPDGHVEDWYGEGNFNRTALLYAFMKSQGVRPEHWQPGVRVGAVRDGERLHHEPRDARSHADPFRLRAAPARTELRSELRPPQRVPRMVRRRREPAVRGCVAPTPASGVARPARIRS